jgi:hypothetical protein
MTPGEDVVPIGIQPARSADDLKSPDVVCALNQSLERAVFHAQAAAGKEFKRRAVRIARRTSFNRRASNVWP